MVWRPLSLQGGHQEEGGPSSDLSTASSPPLASIADALLRRGLRRFLRKKMEKSTRGHRFDDEEERRQLRAMRRVS
eukprot:CAMPEP_0178440802 /NCGR_PEP_ID=MMETSP0689_2-20121128/37020_1 /TAXON_ID=160604 /ORGANISM="Amphidinium massartii, Strain CS-259" /LENGTH=75 /DNA_ID=CAMNT_0020063695 /DNA_START=96 /DNA_END=320 /DNA_ORIENTATION=+